jgi:hypothetical protein
LCIINFFLKKSTKCTKLSGYTRRYPDIRYPTDIRNIVLEFDIRTKYPYSYPLSENSIQTSVHHLRIWIQTDIFRTILHPYAPHRPADRIPIPTRDLPQAVLVYCWRLAGDSARGTPGRRVHGVGKQASSGSGFHREDG